MMNEIILRKKYPDFIDNEYLCGITKFLDDDIRNNYGEFNSYFRCYIYMIVEVGTTIVLLFVCLDQQLGVLSLVMKI